MQRSARGKTQQGNVRNANVLTTAAANSLKLPHDVELHAGS